MGIFSSCKDRNKEGLYTETQWYENGQKWMEGSFKDDKKDGRYTEWYENGQKSSEHILKDGQRDGLWTWWDKHGNITDQTTYKNGKEVK